MRKVLWVFVGLIVLVLGGLGAVLAFDAPVQPPPLASVSEPFAKVDFSDLPAIQDLSGERRYQTRLSGL